MGVIKFNSKTYEWKWLSNFFPCELVINEAGDFFPSVEHAYQACKYEGKERLKFLAPCGDAKWAKEEGKHAPFNDTWRQKKVAVMEHWLRKKFNIPQMKELLLATGEDELIHEVYWHDTFWGVCSCVKCGGKGENMQGKLTMKIRKELMKNMDKGDLIENDNDCSCPKCGGENTTDASGGEIPEGVSKCLDCKHMWGNTDHCAFHGCKVHAPHEGITSRCDFGDTTKVINIKDAPKNWEANPDYVYIGRSGKGMDGSWGNPITLASCGGDRDLCLKKYKAWFEQEFCSDIDRLHGMIESLKGKTLVCFCKPLACHGDVIAEYLNTGRINVQEEKKVKDKVDFPYGVGYFGEPEADSSCKHCFGKNKPMAMLQTDVDEINAICEDCAKKCGYLDNLRENTRVIWTNWSKPKEQKPLVICGTGHRPEKLGGYSMDVFQKGVKLAEDIIEERKPTIVISGGALGWDQMLAVAAINKGVTLHVYAPCHNQDKKWISQESKDLYREILKRAALVKYIHEGEYNSQCMDDRNKAMVDASMEVWALWNGDHKGGTANCVRYAIRQKKGYNTTPGREDLKILNFWKNWI